VLGRNLLKLLAFTLALSAAPSFAQAGPPMTITSGNPEGVRLYNAGIEAYLKHDIPTAQKNFKAAIDIDPKLAEAHCNYGYTLVLDGKYEDALAELTRARDLKPEMASTWSGLGACYQSLGMTPEAVAAYKKYLDLAPSGTEADRVKSLVSMLEGEAARTANAVKNGSDDYIGDATRNGIMRWPAARMPIKTYIKTGTGVPGYRPEFESIFRRCLQEWLEASQGKVKVQFVDSPNDAVMIVSWTNNPKEMISTAEGGHAMISPDSEGISKTHIYLLTTKLDDTTAALTDNQARRIDLHEIGHALGIFGHSHNPGDIMFGSMPPGDLECSLSDKDKNTIVGLYSIDAETVARNPLINSNTLIAGDPNSNVVRAAKLNHEAVDALKNKNFPVAVQKLEQARKLDPTNELFADNLGIAYANLALANMIFGNVQQAGDYFNRAIPLAEKSPNKTNLITVLKNYWTFCKANRREIEAKKVEVRLKELGAIN